jgi:hypothetical protein
MKSALAAQVIMANALIVIKTVMVYFQPAAAALTVMIIKKPLALVLAQHRTVKVFLAVFRQDALSAEMMLTAALMSTVMQTINASLLLVQIILLAANHFWIAVLERMLTVLMNVRVALQKLLAYVLNVLLIVTAKTLLSLFAIVSQILVLSAQAMMFLHAELMAVC